MNAEERRQYLLDKYIHFNTPQIERSMKAINVKTGKEFDFLLFRNPINKDIKKSH